MKYLPVIVRETDPSDPFLDTVVDEHYALFLTVVIPDEYTLVWYRTSPPESWIPGSARKPIFWHPTGAGAWMSVKCWPSAIHGMVLPIFLLISRFSTKQGRGTLREDAPMGSRLLGTCIHIPRMTSVSHVEIGHCRCSPRQPP
ncbi:hypothetical protein HGRIS_006509 [Hohenbuehelia grisea]|uniref:Uncharacterized protein n=1 Tax=Hohenbuehelia grisea TaxID=104357 RepID=A0ABR3J998_9AGAR